MMNKTFCERTIYFFQSPKSVIVDFTIFLKENLLVEAIKIVLQEFTAKPF